MLPFHQPSLFYPPKSMPGFLNFNCWLKTNLTIKSTKPTMIRNDNAKLFLLYDTERDMIT